MNPRAYLESIIPTREMVDRYVNPDRGGYDPEIGWVPGNAVRGGSVHGSKGFYSYEPGGQRRVVHFPERQSRVHTYGDSFTHCDQVSDGETWQEFLAAHLQEPIYNYGIGGHSVYQAYRRMRRTEPQASAEYIVINIYTDDHYRNLDSWRSIRMGIPERWTLPHLRVDVEKGTFDEVENSNPRPEDVYRLCDPDYVWDTYRNDPTLRAVLARKAGSDVTRQQVQAVADGFGLSLDRVAGLEPETQVTRLHTEAALFASRCVLEIAEDYARTAGKKLMVVLSFPRQFVAADLQGRPRYDQTFLDWLATRDFPVADLRGAFGREFAHWGPDVDAYLDRYYIGHHTPAGNFFTAWAIKGAVCDWLDPKPLPYRE